MTMKKLNILLLTFIISLLVISCSKLKDELPTPIEASVHPEGFSKVGNSDFHGKFIQQHAWNLKMCKQCHGTNYNGGTSSVSCLSCHNNPGGPEGCGTCHEIGKDLNGNTSTAERGVGAHTVHLLGNSKGKIVSCAECHNVPADIYQQGHMDTEANSEVMFNSYFANIKTNEPVTSDYDSQLQLFSPNPTYNSVNLSCSNTYCHGYFKNGNLTNAPVWNNSSSNACGTCHGDPTKATLAEKSLPKTTANGGTHVNVLTCSNCHGGVVNSNLQFVDASKHIDGKLNVFGNDIDF
ncbi:MAG: CxxxxCH/CxxCH domain-containing protein [Ignavibacteriales bacterium]|nr:MAG: CxxxxCH/CxxCH domain-containing protein [Ignavibacteriales bacterium]